MPASCPSGCSFVEAGRQTEPLDFAYQARVLFVDGIAERLLLQVSHLVRQAALTDRARQAFLDGADDPGRPVARYQQRIGQAATAHILEKLATARRVLLSPRRQACAWAVDARHRGGVCRRGGRSLSSRTAVSEITERLWAEYESFVSRDLSEFEITYRNQT
jgi:hypothetical protein